MRNLEQVASLLKSNLQLSRRSDVEKHDSVKDGEIGCDILHGIRGFSVESKISTNMYARSLVHLTCRGTDINFNAFFRVCMSERFRRSWIRFRCKPQISDSR